MKVSELIEEQQKLDSRLDVLCSTEDSALLPLGYGFRLFEIEDVSEVEVQKVRGADGVQSLQLERGFPKHALITFTSV